MTWVLAILALSVLIIIHEFGHYVAARIGGMHVDRFSVIGIGPVILRLFTWKGTEFVISAIPFGAYVHIVGMEPEEYAQDEQGNLPPPPAGFRNFRDSPLWARIFAIAGGPIANYIAAMAIAIGVFSTAGVETPVATMITGFSPESPALIAGVLEGDEIIAIDGEDMTGADGRQKIIATTQEKLGQPVELEVLRGEGEQLVCTVELNPEPPALNAQLGIRAAWTPVGPVEALGLGAKYPFVKTAEQLGALWSAITGKQEAKVGGPIAIAKAIKFSADRGMAELILFSALISTLLGLFNLLPLPALDGGRLVFLFYEAITRRVPNKMIEERIHMIGMLALLGLFAFTIFNDLRGEPKPPVWVQQKAAFEVEIAKLEARSCRPEDAPAEPAAPANPS